MLATAKKDFWGFGLTHIYVLQLVDHLKILCDHRGQAIDTGTLLKASLESFAIQAGVHENPFKINPINLLWTGHCWWHVTLTAVHKYKINLNREVLNLHKWAEEDTSIMQDFLSFYENNKSRAFLTSLNQVQLFLKVATRADLMLACS